ncbi:MAG: hypothetical protein WB239_18390 [Acidimicrobiia bacterium]
MEDAHRTVALPRSNCLRCSAEARFMTPNGPLCSEDTLLDLVHAGPNRGWLPITITDWPEECLAQAI